MVRNIYQNYYLPIRPEELSLEQIHFWYDPLIPTLLKMQKNTMEIESKNNSMKKK